MQFEFKTAGVCSKFIRFNIEDNRAKNISFVGGCTGNARGLVKLAENQPVEHLIEALHGIPCNNRDTSCPDQLAKALSQALEGKLKPI